MRVVEVDGEPWLVGKDVATALGYSNPRDALAKHVDDEDKNTVAIHDGIQGNPNMTVINESGLYSLVLSSKLPGAKKFHRWVTSEVLPSIRKHGGYIAGQEQMSDDELSKQASYQQVGRYFYARIYMRASCINVLNAHPTASVGKMTHAKPL